MQHCPVPHAGGGGWIRRIEQDPQSITVQRFDFADKPYQESVLSAS